MLGVGIRHFIRYRQMSMKIYVVIIYLPKMRIIKLTLAVGIVPLNKLQENDFDYKCIINDKKKGDTGTII